MCVYNNRKMYVCIYTHTHAHKVIYKESFLIWLNKRHTSRGWRTVAIQFISFEDWHVNLFMKNAVRPGNSANNIKTYMRSKMVNCACKLYVITNENNSIVGAGHTLSNRH